MAEQENETKSDRFVVFSVVFICCVMAAYVIDRYTGFDITRPFSGSQNSSPGNAEGSLQPAVDACKRVANIQLGPSLLQMKVDPISTRYVASNQEYVVFLNVVIKGKERIDHYFECNVSSVGQTVTRTRLTGPPGSFDKIGI